MGSDASGSSPGASVVTAGLAARQRIRDAIWNSPTGTGLEGLGAGRSDAIIGWFAEREVRLRDAAEALLKAAERVDAEMSATDADNPRCSFGARQVLQYAIHEVEQVLAEAPSDPVAS